jgi:hypothetical protein
MMSVFTDGLKAGFLGGFGVDYYSKKSREVLEDIRDGGVGQSEQSYLPRTSGVDYFAAIIPLMADVDRAIKAHRFAMMHDHDGLAKASDRLILAVDELEIFMSAHQQPPEMRRLLSDGGAPILDVYLSAAGAWREVARLALLVVQGDDTASLENWGSLEAQWDRVNAVWTDVDDQLQLFVQRG